MKFKKSETQSDKNQEPINVYQIEGELFRCTMLDSMKSEILKDVKEGSKITVLDMENMTYANSSGIGVLLSIYKEIADNDGVLSVINLQPVLSQIFVSMKLFKFMRYFESLDVAKATLPE